MLIESGVRVQIQEQAEISLENQKQYLIAVIGRDGPISITLPASSQTRITAYDRLKNLA
jgi:hypothetical protein